MKLFFSFFKHLKLGLKTIPKDLKKPFCLKYKKIPCISLVLLLNTKDTKNTNSGFSLFQNNKNNQSNNWYSYLILSILRMLIEAFPLKKNSYQGHSWYSY